MVTYFIEQLLFWVWYIVELEIPFFFKLLHPYKIISRAYSIDIKVLILGVRQSLIQLF